MSSLPQPPSLMQTIAATTRDVPKTPPAAKQDCSDMVHLAFFFDGTGNNRDADAAGQRLSNVARLFDASMNAPGKGIYSFYVSGVGNRSTAKRLGSTNPMFGLRTPSWAARLAREAIAD